MSLALASADRERLSALGDAIRQASDTIGAITDDRTPPTAHATDAVSEIMHDHLLGQARMVADMAHALSETIDRTLAEASAEGAAS